MSGSLLGFFFPYHWSTTELLIVVITTESWRHRYSARNVVGSSTRASDFRNDSTVLVYNYHN